MAAKYLDYNATTPMDPRVRAAMNDWYRGVPGNPGNPMNLFGRRANQAVEHAREQVAALIEVRPNEIVFTSGATESNNLAILGLAAHGERTGRMHIISTAIEHRSVLGPLREMERRGFHIELAPVTGGGYVEPDAIRERLRPDTLLVSVMHANNETGVLQPIHAIGELLDGTDTLFHTDAAQTFGKEVDSLGGAGWHLLSMSGHKLYGPQGIGAIGIRCRGLGPPALTPLLFGGGQEWNIRPGTLPVGLVVGLGKAAEVARREHVSRRRTAEQVKFQLLAGLQGVDHTMNGDQTHCQPHVVNISFSGIDSEALMMGLRDCMAVSNGAACMADGHQSSYVLQAMGLERERIASAIRISWGPGVAKIPVAALRRAIHRLR